MVYIVIPIYSDPFLHPQHKNNKLSLLYVMELEGDIKNWTETKSYILPQLHPDSSEMMVDYSFLYEGKHKLIITPDAKKLQPIFSKYKNIHKLN